MLKRAWIVVCVLWVAFWIGLGYANDTDEGMKTCIVMAALLPAAAWIGRVLMRWIALG